VVGKVLSALVLCAALIPPQEAWTSDRVHKHSITICSLIITEMTEGRVSVAKAREMSLAIAHAGNQHFGRVTCGDMWLYMAIVYVESGFRNNIINYQNCHGMFQVHAPSWASKFGIKSRDLLDVHINAHVGIWVYKYYLEQYKSVVPALSAYNSDHPTAARGYARTVLGAKQSIKRRYTQLYRSFLKNEMMAFNMCSLDTARPSSAAAEEPHSHMPLEMPLILRGVEPPPPTS